MQQILYTRKARN